MNVVIIVCLIALFLSLIASYTNFKSGLKIAFVLLTILGCIHYNYGNDYISYFQTWNIISHIGLKECLIGNRWIYPLGVRPEIGWILINKLFAFKNGFYLLISAINIIENVIYFNLIKDRVSKRWWWLGVFIYLFSFQYYLLNFSMLRQGLTICLGILALYLFEKKNYILFALIAVFACSIHTSASVVIIAMIVFRIKCVASKKLVPALLITTVVLYFGTGLTTYIFNSVLKYSALSKYLDLYSGITSESSYGIGFFLLVVQYSLMIYFLREESYNISNEERTLILLSYIAFLVRPFTAVGAALITRLGYYFSVFDIVVMPLMFSKLRNKIIRILFVIILVVLIFYSYVQFWNSPVYIRSYEKFHTIFEAFR